jgi:DNA modification methylase
LTIADAKVAGRKSSGRNFFDIDKARRSLRLALSGSAKRELEMWTALCTVGLLWIDICEWLDDRTQHGGKRISATQWAADKKNSPIKKQWLDAHAEFARNWDEFMEAWRWAQAKEFTPDTKPSLRVARDLMELKRRHETHHAAVAAKRIVIRDKPAGKQTQFPERIIVNPAHTIRCGDITEMLRKHVPDGSLDLMIADPPYNLPVPLEPNSIDRSLERYRMGTRFREAWDRFPDVETYAEFSRGWLAEAMRCLNDRRSMFIFCGFQSQEVIGWILQTMRVNRVQNIQVIQLNQRPRLGNRGLQHCHYTIIWASKSGTRYRFHHHKAKWSEWDGDKLNDKPGQLLRDVWCINHNGRQNTLDFPAQKVTHVYDRLLTLTGEPGGMMGDLFSGSGTGAVSALRWGMKCISIERDPNYVANIIKRVNAEIKT